MSFVSEATSRCAVGLCCRSTPPRPGAATIQAAPCGTGAGPASAPEAGIRERSRAMTVSLSRTGRDYSHGR